MAKRLTNLELKESLREAFETCRDDPADLKELQLSFMEGRNMAVDQERIRKACDALCAEGVLELVAKDTYEVTEKRWNEIEQEQAESMAAIFAEHFIIKAAGKR